MAENGLNPWKLATLVIVLVLATAGLTALVVTKWFPSEPVRSASTASEKRTGRGGAAAHGGQAGVLAVQPASAVPPQAIINDCNRYASTPPSDRDKYWEIGKDAVIGGVATAAIGAAAGAIADGGKGAGKGAAIGGIVGVAAGTVYGINANRQADEAYRAAYAHCMHSRGYSS